MNFGICGVDQCSCSFWSDVCVFVVVRFLLLLLLMSRRPMTPHEPYPVTRGASHSDGIYEQK